MGHFYRIFEDIDLTGLEAALEMRDAILVNPFLMGVIPDFLFRTAFVAVSWPKNLLKLILKNFDVSSEKRFPKIEPQNFGQELLANQNTSFENQPDFPIPYLSTHNLVCEKAA